MEITGFICDLHAIYSERNMRFNLISLITPTLILLTACGAEPSTSTPPPPASLPPAVTLVGPTLTPLPPAVTLIAPAATAGAVEPSPTAEAIIGPESYPPGINPLTGL